MSIQKNTKKCLTGQVGGSSWLQYMRTYGALNDEYKDASKDRKYFNLTLKRRWCRGVWTKKCMFVKVFIGADSPKLNMAVI